MPAAFWMRCKHRLQGRLSSDGGWHVIQPVFEPLLHPSRWRIRALGLSTALGHPLFYVIWAHLLPQPYERLWQRLTVGALGACLLLPQLGASPPSRTAAWLFSLIFWVTLPVFFTWMYLCNGQSAVWMASLGAMFLIYYHLTDWRIATVGIATGLPAGGLLFAAFGPGTVSGDTQTWATHAVVFGFCWYMGLVLGLSSSNLRREQLKQALGTMGIMAHELRTPLVTMALIGDAMRNEAQALPPPGGTGLERLATRLHALVRNMNRQIDMQIANAQLLRLPAQHETVIAGELVRACVAAFPYRNETERACVQVQVAQDFAFRGSAQLFRQVIDNLMKNALRSLASLPSARAPGDLRLEVAAVGSRGRICVIDRGAGITQELRARVFQPFVSTHRGTGHGLGLAFCQGVVHEAGGSIRVESAPGQGACFVIELAPLAAPTAPRPTQEQHTP